MAGVKIIFRSDNVAGGAGADAITTTEYTSSTEAEAAVTARGSLPVTTPVSSSGVALKKQHVPLAAIRSIVSL